jgi:hypothetical protein
VINISINAPKSKKYILEQALKSYLKQLKVVKRTVPLDIEIRLVKLDALGYCDFNYDYKYPEINILLNRDLKSDELLITLAHETVHVKQFLRRELKNKYNVNYWKGKASSNLEWEDEAYSLESVLLDNFKNEC